MNGARDTGNLTVSYLASALPSIRFFPEGSEYG